MNDKSPHLRSLESESISIIYEVVSQFRNPVMLYSIGKDSAVMLHLALKAFRPGRPPFSLLHVDTTWKFQEMISFRDQITRRFGVDLIVHINQDGVARGIDPVRSGSALHTQVMKTDALKQALDKYGFDAAFGGARRDEEKSRAKERILSFRTASHTWEPRQQRPELWTLFNTRIGPGESIRAFPLSNWTELDIWEYIKLEGIPVVPLYFAKVRPVVRRSGTLVMVDDQRLPLEPGEAVQRLKVRFRTLGCYPLTGAIESDAETLDDVISEVRSSKVSERQGRLIDGDSQASMERKKREGYF
jgi:sulfate adenylyltransferase subunit 2